jgi:ABC-type multidrug transport system fused ATPase/permease subunit
MDTTIAENVAFGEERDTIDRDRLNRAVSMAGLADVVEGLPEGLATRTGERGVRLSGGQRQRLGIARALYRDPRVLVMDEATSALDNATEAQVMAAIDRARENRTVVIVAHRLDTVKNCDVIHVLEGGRLVASGSFETLQETSPTFRRIANLHASPVAAQ